MNPEINSRARAVAPTEMSRLRWQCRRGMRELDVVMLRFLEQRYPAASDDERFAFESLLELQDPVLLAYVTGKESPDNKVVADVVAQLAVTPS